MRFLYSTCCRGWFSCCFWG